MFDARSPTSRALLSAFDPLLRRLERAPAARPVARVRRDRSAAGELPVLEGAHVLLVTIDALRADHLGSYGYRRPVSPRLDALAAESLVFERAYAQAPHSSYSLSSLHTSEYLHELVELGRPLPSDTLASTLREAGYHSAAFFTDGIFHTEGQKLSSLRDGAFHFALFDHTNREAEPHTDRVLAEVGRLKQRGEPPTLLWVHYFDVHEPYEETTFGTSDMDRYDSEILHVDRALDRLIRELRAQLTRPLVIAISADHGEEFRDHGGVYHGSTLYDEQVRVPLIVHIPGYAPARIAQPVEVIDIAPTLLATTGVAIPESMRGRDLRTLLHAPPDAWSPVFSAVLTKRMALRWPHKLIADLRFGLYELYDLENDPAERRNLAGDRPELLTELRGHVYGWLDSLESQHAPANEEQGYARALRLGRLGDRRAVEPMSALLLDRSAPDGERAEAGQLLAKLADEASIPALLSGLETEPKSVAAEAAIALGRMYDDRARNALLALMRVEDPHLRARAAVSLGRLRDRAAVPALIDALWVAPTQYEREEAVRWLGRLRDPVAVEPLLSLLPEFGLRYLLAVALGQIGDVRAYGALVGMLEWESRTNIRDEVVRGLGLLGDVRAIPKLVELYDREPELHNSGESLVRLGAHARGDIGGIDIAPRTTGMSGLGDCQSGPLLHDWDYTARTHCTSQRARVQLALPLPASRTSWPGAQLMLRARRRDAPEATDCDATLGGEPLPNARFDGQYRELRWELRKEQLANALVQLTLQCDDKGTRLELDHALIVPRTAVTASVQHE
jgi:arylsulfatase A-like enzyme/HEAT repeat protein